MRKSSLLPPQKPSAIAHGEPEQGERYAHYALACAAELKAYSQIPDILECLAILAGQAGHHREAAPLWRGGQDPPSDRYVPLRGLRRRLRSLGSRRYETRWARGVLKRGGTRALRCPPTRRSPTRNVAAANANNNIATRLFLSPRAVCGQTSAGRSPARPSRQAPLPSNCSCCSWCCSTVWRGRTLTTIVFGHSLRSLL
jgi:hypothetical protein